MTPQPHKLWDICYNPERIPELGRLDEILASPCKDLVRRTEMLVRDGGRVFPVESIQIGTASAEKPCLAFVGGVHGVERIGTTLLTSFIQALIERYNWDLVLRQQLAQVRLLFLPLLNPTGMYRDWRANAKGVDLMRNAPLDAESPVTPLVGGHRLSHRIPWYRGAVDADMEPESRLLCDWVRSRVLSGPFALVLDCHSGFGLRDRVWFPYAGSYDPLPHLAEMVRLDSLYTRCYPQHDYIFEPQNRHYLTHGDLWDYLYRETLHQPHKVFLPLTLELGSWRWVKKRLWQLGHFRGMFNPEAPHRLRRVLRRHHVLFEFLLRAVQSHEHWRVKRSEREALVRKGLQQWYS